MDDEANLTEEYASHNEWEYEDPEESKSLVRRMLAGFAGGLLMLGAGYLFGWAISIVIDRINGAS